MRRREFLGGLGSLLVWPGRLRAQQTTLPVIGYLDSSSREGRSDLLDALRQGLMEAGYVEGRNVTIEYRWAENQIERLPALAEDLARRGVSLIFASAIRASIAAKAITSTIPIVFATANDPVRFGLVASLARPQGNATGVAYLYAELGEKRLEILRELVPTAIRVNILANPKNANVDVNVSNATAAAHGFGLRSRVLNASDESDLTQVLPTADRQAGDVLLVLNDPLFFSRRDQIVAIAANHELPAMYPGREYTAKGGLISFGPSLTDAYRQAGLYAGRILRGEKPAQLPVLQPTKFELVVNLKTAKELNLLVPPSLLARADEVIE